MRNLFQVNVEEGRHLWAMVYLLHRYFGKDGREEAEYLLERRSGDTNNPRILTAFNEQTRHWLAFFMFAFFTDRDGKFQLSSLAESAFDPLSRTCRFMLTEEAHHMFVGESGVARTIQRTCEVMKQHGITDPRAGREHGVIDLHTLQKFINFHCSVTLDLYGSDISSNAATYYTTGLKGRYEETKREDDHQLQSDTYPVLEVENGNIVTKHVPENQYAEQRDVAGLKDELKRVLDIDLAVDEWAKEEGIADEELLSRIEQRVDEHMAAKVAQWGPDVMRYVEKTILLQTLDHLWREHLIMLDHLRQVIGLRGYGQRDPLQEYKSEAFSLFEAMIAHLREAVTAQLMRVEIVPPEEQPPAPVMEAHKLDPDTGEDEMAFANVSLAPAPNANAASRDPKNPASWGKVGRNEDCPCGSGKKYKHCHGRYA